MRKIVLAIFTGSLNVYRRKILYLSMSLQNQESMHNHYSEAGYYQVVMIII
jgi:hypothetical protein